MSSYRQHSCTKACPCLARSASSLGPADRRAFSPSERRSSRRYMDGDSAQVRLVEASAMAGCSLRVTCFTTQRTAGPEETEPNETELLLLLSSAERVSRRRQLYSHELVQVPLRPKSRTWRVVLSCSLLATSFRLANNTTPLSVTRSVIAPPARMKSTQRWSLQLNNSPT